MKYLTRAQLSAYKPSDTVLLEAKEQRSRYATFASLKPANSVFLSHSHKDQELVVTIKRFLESQGIAVYIDWLDEGMPEQTSGDTAKKIKAKIEENRKFAVIVSENSKNSKWVPWELGYADKAKSMDNVLIVPVSENDREFSGAEYLQIYYCLEKYQDKWVVWRKDPGSLMSLSDWLKR